MEGGAGELLVGVAVAVSFCLVGDVLVGFWKCRCRCCCGCCCGCCCCCGCFRIVVVVNGVVVASAVAVSFVAYSGGLLSVGALTGQVCPEFL